MSAPIALVPKKRADIETREGIVEMLRKALAKAEAGEIDNLVMIVGYADGEWGDECSASVRMSEAIGRIEITKQEWIAKYLKIGTTTP